jgi:hypothetical protein
MKPLSLRCTATVAALGRPSAPKSGQFETARGAPGSLRSLAGSPGCWTLRNRLRPSGDIVAPCFAARGSREETADLAGGDIGGEHRRGQITGS